MKGKNKFILMLFAVVTLVATGVVFAFGDTAKKIAYAQASTVDGFSAEIDGDVIFSAERVYTATTSENRQQMLKDYNGYEFQAIATNNGVEYFADYRLYNQTIAGDYSHKDVVKDGEFVMADSVASHTVEPDVEEGVDARDIVLTQAIMVTVGGYYHKGNSIVTNAPVLTDVDGVETLVDVGANIQFVAVQATLDGKSLTLPSARTYNSEYQDFTWFIPVTEGNEGHYEIIVSYMVGGKTLLYEFDFYLLLKSSYEDPITVSGNSYEARPTMENATLDNSSATLLEYSFESGTTFNF